MSIKAMERFVVSWNRTQLDLRSDEMLAQILDRGDPASWQELYALAAGAPQLRKRILDLVRRVPLPYPCFWLAALSALGEPIDWTLPVPQEEGL